MTPDIHCSECGQGRGYPAARWHADEAVRYAAKARVHARRAFIGVNVSIALAVISIIAMAIFGILS